jgi:hypothetical protein
VIGRSAASAAISLTGCRPTSYTQVEIFAGSRHKLSPSIYGGKEMKERLEAIKLMIDFNKEYGVCR